MLSIYTAKSHLFSAGPSGSVFTKTLNKQRRLAWSLDKNDTHNRREANFFGNFYVVEAMYNKKKGLT
jgi:hypothetical protein